jgi:hypothetical protein
MKRIRIIALAVVTMVIIAGIAVAVVASQGSTKGSSVRTLRTASQAPTSRAIPSATLRIITLPASSSRPIAITTTASGNVWYWANSGGNSYVYELTAPGMAPRSWDLGSVDSLNLVTVTQGGIAVDKNGKVWVGANTSLVELDPVSGVSQQENLPSLPVDPTNADSLPSQYSSQQNIVALASSPAGPIAIAVENATEVPILDPTSGGFARFSLPSNMESTDVGYLSNDTLGVLERHKSSGTTITRKLVFYAPDGTTRVVTGVATTTIAEDGSGFLAASTGAYIEETGTSSPSVGSAASTALTATHATQRRPGGYDVPIPTTSITAWTSGGGVEAYNSATSTAIQVHLPAHTCASPSAVAANGGNGDEHVLTTCGDQAGLLVATKAGLYISLDSAVPQLAFLPSSSLTG